MDLGEPGALVTGQLVIDALATARVVRLLQVDGITEPLRKAVLDYCYDHGHDRITELMQCSWCLSVWVGVGLQLSRRIAPRLHAVLATGLACSQAASVLISVLDKIDTDAE